MASTNAFASGGGGGGSVGVRSGAPGYVGGNSGGNGNDNGAGTAFAGGGGGGAGSVGLPAPTSTIAGNGGNGTANSITGSSVTRAAGGGGGAYQLGSTGTAGTGGPSIGGNGGRNGLNATGGSPNTGSGGGGNGYTSAGNLQGSSGAGGSGVVILKYPNIFSISNSGGGLTFTTDSSSVAGYKITTFTAGTGQVSFAASTKFRTTSTTVFASELDEFTGAPVVDSSLQLWLDAGQTTSYSGTGTTWTDLSGNGRTGTLTGGPTYSTTNGGSIVFDGINDYVSCAGSLTVTEATFIAWIRRDGTQNPYDGIIFCRGTGSNVSGLAIGQTGTTNQIGYTWHGQSSSYLFTSNLTIPNATWCMIAVSVTSTAATLYLCQSSGITTATNTTSHPSTLLSNIHLAQDNVPPLFDRWFKGNIASAQIYNRALTAAEITQNYNAMRKRFELSAVTSTQMPVVQRQQSSGTLLVNGEFEEYTVPISNTFTTSGSFVVPAGVTSISAVAVGGGGGGAGGSDPTNGGGGGGASALAYVNNIAVTPGETLTVVVGSGGTAGAGSNVGTSGGLSSIARSATILLQANGGTQGNALIINANNNGGAGGTVVTGSGGAGGVGGSGNSSGGGGGGGAGGYSGTGGAGSAGSTSGNPTGSTGSGGGGGGGAGSNNRGGGGGGVGLDGIGQNGSGGALIIAGGQGGLGGSNGSFGTFGGSVGSGGGGGLYGGGGGGGSDSATATGGAGAAGGVKIFYRGAGNAPPEFPALFG
jgi:hypothetical protein